MFKVATMCWGDRSARAKTDFECNDADLDAVLENINLLLNDMEDDLNACSSNIEDSSSLCETFGRNKLTESIPVVRHEFASDISSSAQTEKFKNDLTVSYLSPPSPNSLNHKLKSILSQQHPKQKLSESKISPEIPYRNILRSHSKAHRISSEPVNPAALKNFEAYEQKVSKLSINGRESLSANSSPVLNAAQLEEKYYSIAPRLSLTDTDKFDVSILCPDGIVFKADVYKAWTAFQIAWKIAHVKGMPEKLAIVIEENIADLFLVRPIEDHEIVYSVVKKWAPTSNNSLSIVERLDKYDLFNEPTVYLPLEMFAPNNLTDQTDKKRRSLLLGSLMSSEVTLELRYSMLVKDFDKKIWLKKYLRLKDSCLYISDEDSDKNMTKIFDTKTSFLYHCLPEFSRAHKSPTPYCFCIISDIVTEWSEIKCFCAESDMVLTGWFSGFRIAKYGQQLYINFRDAINKEANLRRTNVARQSLLFRRPHSDHDEFVDNKVALDFSGSNGRIISNPLELMRVQNEIAFEIPKTSKRISATFSPAVVRQSLLQNKLWYHGKCNREQSQHKLKLHGLKKGMFMVRESCTSAGNLVLTVVTQNKKITHYQIFQNFSSAGVVSYGIENGPQFNTLELLIESYHSGAVEGVDFVLKKPCPS